MKTDEQLIAEYHEMMKRGKTEPGEITGPSIGELFKYAIESGKYPLDEILRAFMQLDANVQPPKPPRSLIDARLDPEDIAEEEKMRSAYEILLVEEVPE